MSKEIVIQPVTRIEGHAKVVIQLDDKGDVSDSKVHVLELRGFERFCIGRPIEELPVITTRICGVCPWAHHIASAKATDAVFGVEPAETGRKLRELAYLGDKVMDFILHFYILSGPDFVMGPDADYTVRNVIGIAKANPDLAKQVIKHHHLAHQMVGLIAGKRIHPVAAVPGGFTKPLTKEERDKAYEIAEQLLDFAKFSISNAKENIFPKYLDMVKDLAVIKTAFLSLVTEDGTHTFYDGKLRMMQPDGSYEEFAAENYLDYIAEHIEPWTYLKFPYYKKAGKLVLDPDNPVGVYRVNTLARINACDKMATPLAQKELEEFRKNFGRPAQPTLLYHWARLIEMVEAAERTIQLLEDPEITNEDTRTPVEPRAARGVGVVEASRGTLFHDYESDEKGMAKDVNLIVATCQNNAAINLAVLKAARDLIKGGKYDQGTLNKIEMVIRSYDPCLSCATHYLPGRIAIKLNILNSDGQVIDTMINY
ncbi:MAG: Ni/Fe hydrogenase subunit alpha [Candidatus Heimdallarchaeota archaeon]